MVSENFPGNYITYQVILNGKEKTISFKTGNIVAPDWDMLSYTGINDNNSNFNIPGFWIKGFSYCENEALDINKAVYYDSLTNNYVDSTLTVMVTTTENLRLFKIPEKGTTFIFNGDIINSTPLREQRKTKLTLAPNPVHDRFRIISSDECNVDEIYSITGARILNFKRQVEWYFIQSAPPGIYFVTFKENNKPEKIIIK